MKSPISPGWPEFQQYPDYPALSWARIVGSPDSIEVSTYSADQNMLNNFGLELVAKKKFSSEYSTDAQGAVILNEMAIQKLGFESPDQAKGEFININEVEESLQIVGVVRDFKVDFLWEPVSPLIIRNNPSSFNIVSIQLDSSNREAIIENLEQIVASHICE